MSASQRRKGAGGEREVSTILSETLGVSLKRNLGQAREGGDDLTLARLGGGNFRIEVKRRNTLACEAFLDQAAMCAKGRDVPLVLMRSDGGRWMALIDLNDFMPMLAGEICKGVT